MRYLAAMSGGVDSSAAALLLLEQGHYVEGGIMRLAPDGDGSDIASAQAVCDRLGIKLHVFDMRELFRQAVIGPFCEQYLECKTPNPCVFCNRRIKFGAFVEKADELGFDGVATGHYADIVFQRGRYAVTAASCTEKDQSYFLWDIPQNALARTVFPLRGISSKDEVRLLARSAGLPAASRKDSQDICFVKDGDYAEVIRRITGIEQPDGDFVDKEGRVLGRHKGLLNYTIGHRIYVTGLDSRNNTVILGEQEDLYRKRIKAEKVRLQLYPEIKEMRLSVKIRFGRRSAPATVTAYDGGEAEIEFDSPQRALAPGQSVVFYDGNAVAGGGFICQ